MSLAFPPPEARDSLDIEVRKIPTISGVSVCLKPGFLARSRAGLWTWFQKKPLMLEYAGSWTHQAFSTWANLPNNAFQIDIPVDDNWENNLFQIV